MILSVLIIHHQDDGAAGDGADAVSNAFANERPIGHAGGSAADPWEQVRVLPVCKTPDALETLLSDVNERLLIVLFAGIDMLPTSSSCGNWPLALDRLGQWIKAVRKGSGPSRIETMLFAEKSVADRLPRAIKSFQFKEPAAMGEFRIRAQLFALFALQRARKLLLGNDHPETLELFISHAKLDGLALALALKHLIEQVPELKSWYDADDLNSGDDWIAKLQAAASRSVLIALRTAQYESRSVCCDEFEWAMENGVPVIAVDAHPASIVHPSSLPLSSVPTVRIGDGNLHRVVAAALREHLRSLVLSTQLKEQIGKAEDAAWRFWPRMPTLHALATLSRNQKEPCTIIVADIDDSRRELVAARAWLLQLSSTLKIQTVAEALKSPSAQLA